jgi:hypothetical protein
MRREEFEAAFEPDEDTEEEARETELREELGATGLSEEDEAALIAELAAAEDDAGSDAAEAEAAPGEPAARKPEMPASDDSVDRILARTDTELDKEDGNRRRSAIEHLRAAVAAVRAEGGQDGRVEETEAEKGRYREDLARVVRPERPAARPEGEPARKMPPLMLVSEQRVDRPAADTPPRRGPAPPSRRRCRDVDGRKRGRHARVRQHLRRGPGFQRLRQPSVREGIGHQDRVVPLRGWWRAAPPGARSAPRRAHILDRLAPADRPSCARRRCSPSSPASLVDRLDAGLRARLAGRWSSGLAVEIVAGADLQLVEPVEHVELGQRDAGDARDGRSGAPARRRTSRSGACGPSPCRIHGRARPGAGRSRRAARSGTAPRPRAWCRP